MNSCFVYTSDTKQMLQGTGDRCSRIILNIMLNFNFLQNCDLIRCGSFLLDDLLWDGCLLYWLIGNGLRINTFPRERTYILNISSFWLWRFDEKFQHNDQMSPAKTTKCKKYQSITGRRGHNQGKHNVEPNHAVSVVPGDRLFSPHIPIILAAEWQEPVQDSSSRGIALLANKGGELSQRSNTKPFCPMWQNSAP